MWRRAVAQIPRKPPSSLLLSPPDILLAKSALAKSVHEHRRDGSNAASPFDEAREQ
jgi:hypothetical protein